MKLVDRMEFSRKLYSSKGLDKINFPKNTKNLQFPGYDKCNSTYGKKMLAKFGFGPDYGKVVEIPAPAPAPKKKKQLARKSLLNKIED